MTRAPADGERSATVRSSNRDDTRKLDAPAGHQRVYFNKKPPQSQAPGLEAK
jgi:hypothetical protein